MNSVKYKKEKNPEVFQGKGKTLESGKLKGLYTVVYIIV
jgi:hypothetical protein